MEKIKVNETEKLTKITTAVEQLLREPKLAVIYQSRWKRWLLGLFFPATAGSLQAVGNLALKLQRTIGEIT
jgi:hypothetical protein